MNFPKYPKVITLGNPRTENALTGEVIVQEKVDGSLFRFGINENKELIIGSKNVIIQNEEQYPLFKEGVEYILSIKDKILKFSPNTFFYGEYLQKPKHNVLKYTKTPKNHIVLFDVLENSKYISREKLIEYAEILDLDVIPELYRGVCTVEKIKELLNTDSYLGNEKVEGVVIKNYNQWINLGGIVFPLFTKYVREQFKERHNVEWKIKSPKGELQTFVERFKTEARWEKALIHLKEKGELENSVRDIGKLIKEVQKDIKEEESEYIKNHLYKIFIKDILQTAIRGLPEWYKNKLLEKYEK